MSVEKAVSKLRTEMDQNRNNSYVQVVGSYLLTHLEKYPQDAGNIAAEGKTIAKSLDAMRQDASKKKNGNFAVLAPQEGFDIVMRYFGITESDGLVMTPRQPAAASVKPKAKDIDFDVSLADLL
ncbi:hypothetical protein SOV_17170 [Sporomusa ovata DSM 2662]|uniref:Uncharacterized protein n=1 Tax=Sporomusa ovata TaxID=2378 RepID=A0A0U1KV98_9FIRM|nr:hypothetical protein [Sporomusa ovata]EQB29317.1 hypothetical protein SOV_1c10500 [Sporomusa ovata DSM 2662]CQR71358.1 hypothetical protein SpAn4DRAFT_3863 [Sporomusa ovata]